MPGRIGLATIMTLAIAVALFPYLAFAILSSFLIDDLGMTRTQIGWLAAGFSVMGIAAAPAMGRLTDRFGGRRMLLALFATSFLALIFIAAAPNYLLLLVAAALAGLPQASVNPITNKLIATHVRVRRRGIMTGVKQSGAQVGIFFGGLLLPVAAVSLGWRTALVIASLVPLAAFTLVPLIIPRATPGMDSISKSRSRSPLPSAIRVLAWYGFLMGIGGSAFIYLPLYGQEIVGVSVSTVGAIVALSAVIAIFVRLGFSEVAVRAKHFSGPLLLISGLAAVAAGIVWSASVGGSVLLWVGGMLGGSIGPSSVPVVWLAVMATVPTESAGRATAVPALGYSAGFGLGSPLFGYSIDVTKGYDLVYGTVALAFTAAAFLIWRWRVSAARVPPGTI